MQQLIGELKSEHDAIIKDLKMVLDLGISSEEGQSMLVYAKEGLLKHLKKEDNKLYPILREAAENNPRLKKTMEVFARDMEQITGEAMEFFNKYAQGGSGLDFAKDFGRLYVTLTSRIQKEEDILYKEYETIVKDNH